LTDLQPHEQLVFVGLTYWMIHADERVSDEERQQLAEMGTLFGEKKWHGLETQAQVKYPSARALALGCRNVMRLEARHCIYESLVRLAGSDGYHLAEIKLLNWLALTWGFADQATIDQAHRLAAEPSEDHNTFDLFG
jgi:hypothetical protein